MEADHPFIGQLIGQLLATQAALRGMFKASPALQAAAEHELELWQAEGLASTTPDDILDGIRMAAAALFPHAMPRSG